MNEGMNEGMNAWYLAGPVSQTWHVLLLQMPQFLPSAADCEWRDYCQEPAAVPELPFAQCPCPPRSLPWQSPAIENGTSTPASPLPPCPPYRVLTFPLRPLSPYPGYQLRASIYSYGPADSQPSPFALDASIRSAEALSGKQTPFHTFIDSIP